MMRLRRSDVEEEVHDVAVLNDVVLAFGAHLAGFLSALFTLEGNEVFVGDRLGAPRLVAARLKKHESRSPTRGCGFHSFFR